MRRLLLAAGVGLAALATYALTAGSQPTGGAGPPFPYNPARYKDAPAPPPALPNLESWGGYGSFVWGDYEDPMGAARLKLDFQPGNLGYDLGFLSGTGIHPRDMSLRFETPWQGGSQQDIRFWPQPMIWRAKQFYRANDIVRGWPETKDQWSPEADCISGTTMPMSTQANSTGWPWVRYPYSFYPFGARLRKAEQGGGTEDVTDPLCPGGSAGGRCDNELHVWSVTNAAGCWTGGYVGSWWTPSNDGINPISYRGDSTPFADGSCSLVHEAHASESNNVADNTCVWDEYEGGVYFGWRDGMEIGQLNHHGTGMGILMRGADNVAGPFIARQATINQPPTQDDTIVFGLYGNDPRTWMPSLVQKHEGVTSGPAIAVTVPGSGALPNPQGRVELVPKQGTAGTPLTGNLCHFFSYAWEYRRGVGGRTGMSPVYPSDGRYINGLAGSCNAATGVNCDAYDVVIREPVPSLANLVLYHASANCEPTGPITKPSLFLEIRTLEDPDGDGAQTVNTTCGTPCVISVETLDCGGGTCELSSGVELANFSSDPSVELYGANFTTDWAPSTTYQVYFGNYVRPTLAKRNGKKYRLLGNASTCTGGSGNDNPCPKGDYQNGYGVTCTSGSTEPNWNGPGWPQQRDVIKDGAVGVGAGPCLWITSGSDQPLMEVHANICNSGNPDQCGPLMRWGSPLIYGAYPWGEIDGMGNTVLRPEGVGSTPALRLRRPGGIPGLSDAALEFGTGTAGATPDVNLYRGGPDQLKTDDDLLLRGTVSSQAVYLTRTDPSPNANGGGIMFGPSDVGSADTGIYRVTPEYLGTDDIFWVAGGRLEVGLNSEVVFDDQLGPSAGSGGIQAGTVGGLDALFHRGGSSTWALGGTGTTTNLQWRDAAGVTQWTARRVQTTNAFELRNTSNARTLVVEQSTGKICTNSATGTCPNGAAFGVTSTTGGITSPRMTEAQRDAITTPVDGTSVFVEEASRSERSDERAAGAWIPASAPKFDVRRFGANCSDGLDDTAAIDAAIESAKTDPSGAVVHFPRGQCRVSSIVVDAGNITLEGEGVGATFIVGTNTTAWVIDIGGVNDQQRNAVRDLSVTLASSLTGTNGGALRCTDCHNATIENVSVGSFGGSFGLPFVGISFTNGSYAGHLTNIAIYASGNDGLQLIDTLDFVLIDVEVYNVARYGFLLDAAEGTRTFACHSFGAGLYGWRFQKSGTPAHNMANGFHVGCVGDTSYQHNFSIIFLQNSRFVNCWAASQKVGSPDASHGFLIQPANPDDVRDLQFVGSIAYYNNDSGWLLDSGSNRISISGSRGMQNGRAAAQTDGAGARIWGASNVTITGSDFSSFNTDQNYGIRIGNGADNYQVTGNNVRANTVEGINDGTNDADSMVINNSRDQADGIPTVASVAGTITLPSRLDFINVSGTNAVTSITASYPGREVTLKMTSSASLIDGVNLKLASGYPTGGSDTNDRDTITLRCDGTDWYEVSRSIN